MKILRNLLIGLVALVALLGIVGFFLPSTAHVERSVEIDAPVATVYGVVSDLSRFNEWSPWYELDPDARYTSSGSAGEVGSRMSWESEMREVGSGSQTITEVVPNELVRVRLDFGEQGDASSFYKLSPVDGGTRLVWGFDADMGANPYMHYFALFMDSMLGPQYERGLEKLKRFVEDGATSS